MSISGKFPEKLLLAKLLFAKQLNALKILIFSSLIVIAKRTCSLTTAIHSPV